MSADRISRAAEAAEQLCSVLWEAVHEELQAGRPLLVAELTDRLAEVCASVSAVAHAGAGPASRSAAAGDAPAAAGAPAGPAATAAPANGHAPQDRVQGRSGQGLGASRIERGSAALVDEHEGVETPIAIRDVRGVEGHSWIEAVQRRLDRYAEDRERFAVLLIEVLEADRLRLAQSPADAYRQIRDVEGAIVEQLRPADALLRESDGRYWLIAPQTDAVAARALAERIAVAARRAASHRGAPLEVAAGTAVCPEHGIDAASLTGHADVDLYAAQAAGRSVSDPGDARPPI